MSREMFVPWGPELATRSLIRFCNNIIAEYQDKGYTLTVRQIYYQCVQRKKIPNNIQSYKRLADVLNKGRLAGMVDWSAIEDRTRNLQQLPTWRSPQGVLAAVAEQYREDPWRTQPCYVEAWIEKEALIGVLERVANEWRIPFFACRGFTSQSEMHDAGKRLGAMIEAGKRVHILHLGDHDPSGWDMSRDNYDRLRMFARGDFKFHRLGLNMDQIEALDLPPDPAKASDSRFKKYVEEFEVEDSWELDALDPDYIANLVNEAIRPLIHKGKWEAAMKPEVFARAAFRAASQHWEDVTSALIQGPKDER